MSFPTSQHLTGLSRLLRLRGVADKISAQRPDLADRVEVVEDRMYVAIKFDDGRRVVFTTFIDPVERLAIGTPDGELAQIAIDSSAEEIATQITTAFDSFGR